MVTVSWLVWVHVLCGVAEQDIVTEVRHRKNLQSKTSPPFHHYFTSFPLSVHPPFVAASHFPFSHLSLSFSFFSAFSPDFLV